MHIVLSASSLAGCTTRRIYITHVPPGDSSSSGSKGIEFQTTGAEIAMLISGSPNVEYEIIEVQPREFGVGLRFPEPRFQDGSTRSGYTNKSKTATMEALKSYLTNEMGLRINVDFKFEPDKDFFPTVRFSPEHDSIRSMLALMWSEK